MSEHIGGSLIRIVDVAKRFGDFTAVDRLSLEIGAGEFFALLGPSGCGKTTLLRMLAGFETPDSGQIWLNGADITRLPPHLRPVNMMFQSYALFPHLTVAGNIAFGLRREGVRGAALAERVGDMVRLARLTGLEQRKPHELSGGQKQRVALARALAKRPLVLLLDEPLAALDKKLREDTQFELTEIQRRLGMTFVIVTHDQDEAMSLASRIGVMERGRLAQVGTPAEIYEQPATRYVAEFVGDINIFEGVVDGAEGVPSVRIAGHGAVLAIPRLTAAAGARVVCAVRPERIAVHPPGQGPASAVAATFLDSAYLGGSTRCRFLLADGSVVRVTLQNQRGGHGFAPGQPVHLAFAPDAAFLLEG